MKTNFSQFKFRCHQLPALLSNGRGEGLSETAKSKLLDIFIEAKYNRVRVIDSRYTSKGVAAESDSLELVSQFHKQPLFKNIKTFENEYLQGTPDVIKPYLVEIKSSYDIWSLFNVDEKEALKRYEWQCKGYCYLTGQKKCELWFALSDTPLELIKNGEAELYPQNFEFSDIPPKQRVKKYVIKLEKGDVKKMQEKIELCREYLAELEKRK